MIESIMFALKDTMHFIASILLMPTIAVLLLLLAFTTIEFGGLLVEMVARQRRVKVNVPELVSTFQGQDAGEILEKINRSPLFQRQKQALGTLIQHSDLPAASQRAVARRLLAGEELHYARITAGTDLVARLGPMLGLMATLIPLGPGMIAMGQGDTKTLADSLLTAFDATVAGLAAAGIAFAISRLRKRWYEEYLSSLEALTESLLEVLTRARGITEQE